MSNTRLMALLSLPCYDIDIIPDYRRHGAPLATALHRDRIRHCSRPTPRSETLRGRHPFPLREGAGGRLADAVRPVKPTNANATVVRRTCSSGSPSPRL